MKVASANLALSVATLSRGVFFCVSFSLLGLTAQAQGTVTFANASTTIGWMVQADRNVHWDSSATNYSSLLQPGDVVSSNYAGLDLSFLRAALCYGTTATTNPTDFLVAAGSIATFKGSTSTTAGSWFLKRATLDTIPFDSWANACVVVWDIRLSSDPLSPVAQTGLWGRSDVFVQSTSTFNGPFGDPLLENLRAFSIGIPEPTTSALFALSLLINSIRRRQSRRSQAATGW